MNYGIFKPRVDALSLNPPVANTRQKARAHMMALEESRRRPEVLTVKVWKNPDGWTALGSYRDGKTCPVPGDDLAPVKL